MSCREKIGQIHYSLMCVLMLCSLCLDVGSQTCWNNTETTWKCLFVSEHQKLIWDWLIWTLTMWLKTGHTESVEWYLIIVEFLWAAMFVSWQAVSRVVWGNRADVLTRSRGTKQRAVLFDFSPIGGQGHRAPTYAPWLRAGLYSHQGTDTDSCRHHGRLLVLFIVLCGVHLD